MTHTNTVANHVIATCLRDTSMTPQEGPRLWRIQEAEECRGLGNFSSLHTILSALQSPAINHLRDLETSFQEVTSVLETAERARQGAQERQRQQGVVPSLVTFFSSLELLDATMEDYVELVWPTPGLLGRGRTSMLSASTCQHACTRSQQWPPPMSVSGDVSPLTETHPEPTSYGARAEGPHTEVQHLQPPIFNRREQGLSDI
ncbi:ral guanine nucleotide dissociation stimulator-like [Equus caballus]|uniref:ral guanine nucleotide dissociation stimulator-like n=1 Tax=Equus caballus TaxID=9796 RepID=UPI0038B381B7